MYILHSVCQWVFELFLPILAITNNSANQQCVQTPICILGLRSFRLPRNGIPE